MGIALAVLLAYSTINPTTLAFLNSWLNLPGKAVLKEDLNATPVLRDSTFFNGTDGTLTTYVKTVLWVNCGWTLWKILILLIAYTALWIASGQSCAGICGTRHRWEEEERIEWEDATNVSLRPRCDVALGLAAEKMNTSRATLTMCTNALAPNWSAAAWCRVSPADYVCVP